MHLEWITSTPDAPWVRQDTGAAATGLSQQATRDTSACTDRLTVGPDEAQTIAGFGGCFNELGWMALGALSPDARDQIVRELFDTENGLGLGLCRIPIGASDYAAQWYSCNETDGDLAMDHFSIDRDRVHLIPYIKAAQAINPDMRFFASPWSPPTWMKQPKAYNYGRLRMEPAILDSYALYLQKFIEAYADEGIPVAQLHIQNEPYADQKFPSCLWSPEQFRVFLRDHIGPRFEQAGMETELWLGTLNGPTQMGFTPAGIKVDLYERNVDTLLFDPAVRRYIAGIGYQWAGQHVIQRTHESFPEIRLMQTENECGDGTNTWEYAQYVFNLIRHYLGNGAEAYVYWNMVLAAGGESTWGWHQNTLVTVDPDTGAVVRNPEYWLMRHFSGHVRPGAKRLVCSGHWNGSGLAFRNPDGAIVVQLSNALARPRTATIDVMGETRTVTLAPDSFNTLIFRQ